MKCTSDCRVQTRNCCSVLRRYRNSARLSSFYLAVPCARLTLRCRAGTSEVIALFICAATHCNTLQHTATRCNTLHHAASHCNTLQHKGRALLPHHAGPYDVMALRTSAATHCNTLQYTMTYCHTLQHTATRCSTP